MNNELTAEIERMIEELEREYFQNKSEDERMKLEELLGEMEREAEIFTWAY